MLVEFTADWCINCKVLERTVYRDPRAWGGAGIPFAVVLDAQGRVSRRLPDLFSRDALIESIQSTGG